MGGRPPNRRFQQRRQGVAALYAAPCTEAKVLAHIPPQYREKFRAGEGTYEGPKFALCWADVPDGSGDVIIVWEDGGMGRSPVERPGTGT